MATYDQLKRTFIENFLREGHIKSTGREHIDEMLENRTRAAANAAWKQHMTLAVTNGSFEFPSHPEAEMLIFSEAEFAHFDVGGVIAQMLGGFRATIEACSHKCPWVFVTLPENKEIVAMTIEQAFRRGLRAVIPRR